MFHNLFDTHIHTDNSPDAKHSVMYIVERAERMGMMGIAITDHVDCQMLTKHRYNARILQSIVDVAKASAIFRNRMSFSMGIELGVDKDLQTAEKIVSLYPYDYVLGSVHFSWGDQADYYEAPYDTYTETKCSEIFAEYLGYLLAMARWGGFDSLAHLTYPLRSIAKRNGHVPDLEPHTEIIDEILRTLAQNGKALEINTSGLRSPIKETLPPPRIVKRFRELGGEYITIGSDAHRVEDIGAGIEDAMEIAKDAGFSHFAFYRQRQPVMLKIV